MELKLIFLLQFKAPIYRQLSKRLGRIIKHSLQYISEHWEDFQESHQCQVQDKAMLARIEIEYNNFFLRSARSIFCSSATSGMWQYLAVIPYKNVNEAVLWHVLAMYHFVDEATLIRTPDSDIVAMLDAKDFRASFEDTLSGLPDTEVMFLLTTFAHMAISRTYQSSESFICFVIKELLSVGFLNPITSPSCAKGCRDHLSTVTRTHPEAISFLLRQFSCQLGGSKLVDSSNALYITRDLNLDMWKPSDQDFNLLGQWLTRRPLCSNFSLLSRMVFSKLNWAILPWQRHSDLALFVIQSGATYAPDCIAGNFIQDGVRQVSNIANKLRRTPEQIWSSWAWEMVSRLRLHQNDIVVENR